jgi:hypothetical protein
LATVTVNVAVPDAIGVPERIPPDVFKLSPEGRAPLLTAHVSGVLPEAASVSE